MQDEVLVDGGKVAGPGVHLNHLALGYVAAKESTADNLSQHALDAVNQFFGAGFHADEARSDSAARDPGGERIEGHARVRGRRARMPTYQEVGEQVGRSAWAVKKLVQSALDKVRKKLGAEVLEELGRNTPEGS